MSASRGSSSSLMREVRCKDCIREVEAGLRAPENVAFTYNEAWAQGLIERGGSRSDRCREHRLKHKTNTQGMAVAYIDLQTVGQVAARENPTGPLGGLGPLPAAHEAREGGVDLEQFGFGMNDDHIREMLEKLADPKRRVLVLKAGTGTGKSTFGPYRLMDPPLDVKFRLTELGPIVVTEPRVQATTGVATFVGKVMSGSGGVGPGYPVGYQVSGDRNHDDACQLIYVTDGTMINWLREGRLSQIGTVIVDEAHERSTNIDFILGYLRRELHRYPHLRVIVTSATFSVPFYEEFFGGPDLVHTMDVPAVKTIGYGMPLFGDLDVPGVGEEHLIGPEGRWTDAGLPLTSEDPLDPERFIRAHWRERYAPPLGHQDVVKPEGCTRAARGADGAADDASELGPVCDCNGLQCDVGWHEDLWDTTRKLLPLRYTGGVPVEQWKREMPRVLTEFVIQLAQGLDEAEIFGDILGFLPTTRTIEPACEEIAAALGDSADVYPLISSLDTRRKEEALAARRKGDKRKIVISTNLAETSLTVEGVRFVVDTGIIAQSEWDPDLAQGGIPTKEHSQAGIKQRWGRVGRKAPGWVFPLYTKAQYAALAEDTPPGSTRDNLEQLVMTAKMGGIDDVVNFPWPAAFLPERTQLDQSALDARQVFLKELARADRALHKGGAVDEDGHPTSFGRELVRFGGLGSAGSAMAILYADRLGCVPEVVTVMALLEDARLIGKDALLLSDYDWPNEWRVEAAERHRGLATMCEDDADLVLQICAGWERADPSLAPWEPSRLRRDWARRWWVSDAALLAAAEARREVLQSLSPAMKEEVKRFVEPALLRRTRGVLTRALHDLRYDRTTGDAFVPHGSQTPADETATLETDCLIPDCGEAVLALRRRSGRDGERFISSVVRLEAWALPEPGADPATDALRLVVRASEHASADPARSARTVLLEQWPVGQRIFVEVASNDEGEASLGEVQDIRAPFERPMTRDEASAEKAERKRAARAAKKARRTRTQDTDEPEATEEDQKGDLGNLRPESERLPDEEQLEAEAFERADAAGTTVACRVCPQCLSGFEDLCEEALTIDVGGRARDALQSWNARLAHVAGTSTPHPIIDEPVEGAMWWEVAGYDINGDRPAITLRPDWRAVGAPANPAHHEGVEPGDPIEVRVGPMLRDHSAELRSFIRTDGAGRFILREASPSAKAQEARAEIAASLDRSAHGLLGAGGLVEGETLTATVVPARGPKCYSITLLELLDQHYTKAAGGECAPMLPADPSKDRGDLVEWRTGKVLEPVDRRGEVLVELSPRDSRRGVRHLVRVPIGTGASDSSAADDEPRDGNGNGQTTGAEFVEGAPVAVRLERLRPELSLSGRDLRTVEKICEDAARSMRIENAPDEPAEDGEKWIGGPKTRLRTLRGRPLDRASAMALAELDESSDWKNDVWSFWARSHHLRPARDGAVRPYEAFKPLELEAVAKIDTGTRGDQLRSAFEAAAQTLEPGKTIEGRVTSVIAKTGAFVEVAPGVEGLVPRSELRWESVADSRDVVSAGETVAVRIQSFDPEALQVGLSIKALLPHPVFAWAEEHPHGSVVAGIVRRVTPSGAIVDLDAGVDGFVARRDMSWQQEPTASDLVEEGESIRAVVLALDEDRRRMKLSMRELVEHPIRAFAARHPAGTEVKGPVKAIGKDGIFVGLVDGLDGFVHVSELAWTSRSHRIDDPSTVVSEGETVDVRVVDYDMDRRRVRLSMRACQVDPLERYATAHPPGSLVTGAVQRLDDHAAQLKLDTAVDGRVHISEIAWEHIEAPSDVLRVGQKIEAKVIDVDRKRRQVNLSIKRVGPEPLEAFAQKNGVGSEVIGTIESIKDFGAFVNLGAGVKGLIHVSKLSTAFVSSPAQVVSVGQRVVVRVLDVDRAKRRIALQYIRQATPHAGGLDGLFTLATSQNPPKSTTSSHPPRVPAPAPKSRTRPPTPPPRVRRSAEASGDTVDAAAATAARSLRLTRQQVEVTVLADAQRGLFGRIKRQARVRVTER